MNPKDMPDGVYTNLLGQQDQDRAMIRDWLASVDDATVLTMLGLNVERGRDNTLPRDEQLTARFAAYGLTQAMLDLRDDR